MKCKNILVIDNYDSFTYNLVHLLKELSDIRVFRSDKISLSSVKYYDKILLSPGPGLPDEYHILKPLIKCYAPYKEILGICLGQQAIVEAFGGSLFTKKIVYHGISSKITILDHKEKIFKDLPKIIEVGRYHSWLVSEGTFPENLKITAKGPLGEIMALSHKIYDVVGLQFHPESILTPFGKRIISNWL